MRATRNRHDCANDGTCGQSIRSCEIGSTDISFFSNNRDLIVKIPKLPKYSGDKYRNNLYKEAESKQFNQSPKIDDVLSNSFIIKYRYINCTIKYDNLSKQEQNQIETDVKTAYEAFKEKFCLESNNANYDITAYIFNNRSDYAKYNDLLDINADGGPGYTIRGVTDYRNILTYKQVSMDFVLGHELGHIFQMRFSPANKVRDLHKEDTEFIANIVGREVEEKNYIAICKPGEDEDKAGRTNPEPGEEPGPGKESEEDTQQPSNSLFNVIYSAVEYIVGSISSFFSWLFEPKEEEQPGQQSDDNHSLFKFDANELGHDVGSNNHLSDNYHPPDELI